MSFKDHFSGHAQRYAAARPTYPAAMFDWLAQQTAGTRLAWDAGCGNGQAAVALADRFDLVHATDPSANQIRSAAPHTRVRYAVEPAEQCSLAGASADLVTVAQALHWFDLARFHAEVQRVLKPGGVYAAWSYALMRITPAVDALVMDLYEPVLGPYWPPERRHVEQGYRELAFPFAPLPAPPFEMQLAWTPGEVLAYIETWSALQHCRKATGRDPLAPLAERLLAAWDAPATQARTVRWPLSLRAMRVP